MDKKTEKGIRNLEIEATPKDLGTEKRSTSNKQQRPTKQ